MKGEAENTLCLAYAPQHPVGALHDLLRNRFTAFVTDPYDNVEAPASPLFERIRAAFDPDGVFQPGRGFGAR